MNSVFWNRLSDQARERECANNFGRGQDAQSCRKPNELIWTSPQGHKDQRPSLEVPLGGQWLSRGRDNKNGDHEAPSEPMDCDAALPGTLQHTVMQDLTGHRRTEISQTLPPGCSVWPTCILVGPLDDRRARDGKSEQSRWRIVALGRAPRRGGKLPGHCCGMLHMRSVALHLAFVIVSTRMYAGASGGLERDYY